MASLTLQKKIDDFLAQKRIAVVGVSRNEASHPVGNMIFRRLRKAGHDVVPVNPHIATFDRSRCYPDLRSITGSIDGVVIVTRPDVTEQVVRECGDLGVRRVWIHRGLAHGSSVSKAAVDYCRDHDIAVIAGACPMMYGPDVDFGHTCMRWMLTVTSQLPA